LQRILLIQLRQIGDVLMCTPALKALREKLPDARIDFLAEFGPAKILAGNPHLSEVIFRHPGRGASGTLRLLHLVRSRRYDAVIDFLANPRSAVIALFSGAPLTISYAGGRRSFLYKRTEPPRGDYSASHKLSLLRALNIGLADENPENACDLRPVYVVSARARAFARRWLDEAGVAPGEYIVIDPTHRRPTRRWGRFAELADMVDGATGAKCVFLWGPGEEDYVDAMLRQASRRHLKAPPTSVEEMAAVIENAAALVGTDSAPRHLAAALGVPSLVVTGSTDPKNWTLPEPIHQTVSMGLECQPCNSNKCEYGDIPCMKNLGAKAVFEALVSLAKNSAGGLFKLLEKKE